MKHETGILVMKDGKAWGIVYKDGHSTQEGWVNPEDAPLHDPKFLTRPEDITWEGSHYRQELRKGHLAYVERITEVRIISIH